MRRMWIQVSMLAAVCVVALSVYIRNVPNVAVSRSLSLLGETSEIACCEVMSDNTLECDIATVSNIVIRMKSDGYTVVKSKITEEQIELKLKSTEVECRILYESNGRLTCIAAPYEKSSVILPYIDEE